MAPERKRFQHVGAAQDPAIHHDGDPVYGRPTAAYIYLIAGEYVIGINGAGWNFYDGVRDRLYDVSGLRWHEYANA